MCYFFSKLGVEPSQITSTTRWWFWHGKEGHVWSAHTSQIRTHKIWNQIFCFHFHQRFTFQCILGFNRRGKLELLTPQINLNGTLKTFPIIKSWGLGDVRNSPRNVSLPIIEFPRLVNAFLYEDNKVMVRIQNKNSSKSNLVGQKCISLMENNVLTILVHLYSWSIEKLDCCNQLGQYQPKRNQGKE